jgi:hypothetical protein
MRSAVTAAAAMLLAAVAGSAAAQCTGNLLTNPSFENPDPSFPFAPEGWADIPLDTLEWADGVARTGTRSIAIGSSYPGLFGGWTTNIFDPNGGLYDPPYVYQGGDLVVSGYFRIDDSDPLAPGGVGAPNDVVGIKLELRRQNFSIYQAFEYTVPVSTTGGEWQYFEAVLDDAAVTPDFPPFPVGVTILPFRFDTGNGQQGTIYWDDFCVLQGSTCLADVNGDGIVDFGDVGKFVTDFAAQSIDADLNGDGIVDFGDVGEFVNAFNAGC